MDREPPGWKVDIRRSVDVELLEVPRPPAVPLPLDPVTNRPRLGVFDKAQARVTLANPLSQEGEQQAVALGRTRIESANVRTRTNLAHTRNTHADCCRHRKVLGTPLSLRGSSYPYPKGPAPCLPNRAKSMRGARCASVREGDSWGRWMPLALVHRNRALSDRC